MSADTGTRLFITRDALDQARLGPDPDAPAARPLADGEVRFAVQHFALTANNITYAAFGEAMQYWHFFPAPDAGAGCLPVWGYAVVTESRCEGVAPGRRAWGYWPAGTHLVVQPARLSARGFTDGAAHRQPMAVLYNQYSFCDADPAWSPRTEGLQSVLRPLFATSFLIDDWLDDNHFFGAQQVLLSSASSKTALGTAFCLSLRRGRPGAPRVIGLTSPANRAYTEGLGLYDRVFCYDELGTLDTTTPSVYVDFAGNAALRRKVHEHFAGALQFSSSIGGTHWQSLGGARDLPGPKPTLFFAPAQVAQRSKPPPEGWGPGGVQQRLGLAWAAFMEHIDGAAAPWVRVVERQGGPALLDAYAALLAGRTEAGEGLMLSLRG
jgi:Protein of unknown function (DUF2855)